MPLRHCLTAMHSFQTTFSWPTTNSPYLHKKQGSPFKESCQRTTWADWEVSYHCCNDNYSGFYTKFGPEMSQYCLRLSHPPLRHFLTAMHSFQTTFSWPTTNSPYLLKKQGSPWCTSKALLSRRAVSEQRELTERSAITFATADIGAKQHFIVLVTILLAVITVATFHQSRRCRLYVFWVTILLAVITSTSPSLPNGNATSP